MNKLKTFVSDDQFDIFIYNSNELNLIIDQ